MKDLSHWDKEEEFSPSQAAALIYGLDPDELGDVVAPRVDRGLAKLSEGHRVAIALVAQPALTRAGFVLQRAMAMWSHALISTRLDFYAGYQPTQWFYGPDGDFKQQRFTRAELHRWLGDIELRSDYKFQPKHVSTGQTGAAALGEPSAALMSKDLPVVPVSASGQVASLKTDWKMQIQVATAEHWKQLRASGANPTVNSVIDRMAAWCRENDVRTDSGINPSASYLRVHVLGGRHWSPPR